MATRDAAPAGAPCWIDLMTSDVAASRAFYCELFGWTAEEPVEEFGGYFNFRKGGVRVAGCMVAQPDADEADAWSVYLATDDATKTCATAVAGGGQVLVEPMVVGDLGTMAYLTDPGGAGVGVWQPGLHQGFGVYDEAGAPSWFELHTRDYRDAVEFYRSVFGWDTHVMADTPDFRYTTLTHGGTWLAGVMDASGFLPDGAPASWSVYFGVDDADAALTRIAELGGRIEMPAEDTPYGRLAVAADPAGARFKLVGPTTETPAPNTPS